MTSVVSTVPAALNAIVTALKTSPDLTGVQVVYGQPLQTEPDVICVGFTGIPGEAAVESTRTIEQLRRDPDREQYTITCLASSWRGDTDPKAVADRAYDLVNVVADVLVRDPKLGGVVTDTRISADRFAQEQTDKGAVATVSFEIMINAYTR